MNTIHKYFSLFFIVILFSCKKDSVKSDNDNFVKLISTDEQMATVASFRSSDNQFIVVGRSYDNSSYGLIVKLNQKGEEIWRKQIPESNKMLWNAAPVQGGGFITIGWEQSPLQNFNVIKYDDSGNVLLTDTISVPNSNNGCSPADIIQLPNGNFIFATSANGPGKGFIIVTNGSFDVLHTEVYSHIQTDYDGCMIRGLQQINDSTIAFSASASRQVGYSTAYTNSMLITADLNGVMRSLTFLTDTTQSETTNFLGLNNHGLLSITSSMVGWNSGQGVYVNYLNNSIAEFISGRINLLHYDSSGNFKSRNKIYSYPGNGVISTGKPTMDGGFILVGTVNQNNIPTVDASTQIFLLKVDANFNQQWSRVVNTIYPSFGVDVIEANDGGYFVSGYQYVSNKYFNMMVVKTDASGKL